MNQNEFNRTVARAIGETVQTITNRGFALLRPVPFQREQRHLSYDDFVGDVRTSACRQARKLAAT